MCIDDPSEKAEAEDIDRKASMVYELSKAVCLTGKIDLANEMKTDKVISSYMKQELFSEEDPLIIGELKDEDYEITIFDGVKFKIFKFYDYHLKDIVQFHSRALLENQVMSNHYNCIVTFRGVEFTGLKCCTQQ